MGFYAFLKNSGCGLTVLVAFDLHGTFSEPCALYCFFMSCEIRSCFAFLQIEKVVLKDVVVSFLAWR